MTLLIGGSVFGIIVGYLAWHAIRLGEPGITITLKTVSAFIAVVGGAAIMTLFQTSTDLLASYFLGLGVGFFFTPIQKFVFRFTNVYKNAEKEKQTEQDKTARAKQYEQEKNDIDAKWPSIKDYVKTKLDNPLYHEFGLYVDFMKELDYSLESKIYILKYYAQEHLDEGLEIDDSFNKFGELIPSHDPEHTHLRKNPFFVSPNSKRRKGKN